MSDYQATYSNDPAKFVREVVGITTCYPKQEIIMKAVVDNQRVAVRAPNGTGKCARFDERIPLANGAVVRVDTLVGKTFEVLAYNADGTQVPSLAFATDNGVQPTYRITTISGREIIRTGNHPLLAAETERRYGGKKGWAWGIYPKNLGWVHIQNLKVGQSVAITEKLSIFHDDTIASKCDDEIKLAAYLIADGGITKEIGFTQQPGIVLSEFCEIVGRIGCKIRQNGLTSYATGGKRGGQAGCNKILNMVREWGIFGSLSKEKHFPDWVWTLPNDKLALFLNRLFSRDGWAYTNPRRHSKNGHKQIQVAICFASEILLRDVELAMLRFGVMGTVRAKYATLNGRRFRAWIWECKEAVFIRRFAEQIGIYGKEKALYECVKACDFVSVKRTQKWKRKEIADGYRWDIIKSIEPLGEAPTVCISVPDHHTFVTTFVEHNSWIAAFLVIWAMTMFKGVRVVTTASTNRQVRLMWDTVRTIYARSSTNLGGRILQQEMHAEALGNHAVGYSTDDPGKFEGAHGEKRTLVIIDEAKSVPQTIFDAVERLLTSGEWVRLLVISSPGSPIGPFYDCFHRHSDIYKCFHVQMGESPYVRPEYVAERRVKWGEKSPLFLSSCMGEFSIDENGNIVIPLTYIQRIVEDPPEWVPDRGVCAGIDLSAGGGDESAFSVVVGNKQMELVRWSERDTMVTTGKIIQIFKDFRTKYGLEMGGVNIDSGGLGIGICDRLRELGYDFNRFNFGGAAIEKRIYRRIDAEVWDTVGRMIERKEISLLDPQTEEQRFTLQDLQCQLSGRKSKPRSDGLIELESKEEMRKRMLPSPDLADATILSFAGRRVVELRMENAGRGHGDDEGAKPNIEEQIRAKVKAAQEIAERIRDERENNG